MDEDELKKVFRAIDADNSGSISEAELKEAMLALGVKVSVNSAKKVLKTIDKDGSGYVEWSEFQAFFGKVSNPSELKALLSSENQRFFEYKQMVEGDASFARIFAVPPSYPQRFKMDGHNADVQGLAWLSDTHILSGSIDGSLALWDVSVGGRKLRPVKQMVGPALYTLAAAPDGKNFVTGHASKEKNVSLWNLADASVVQTYDCHTEAIFSSAFSADGYFFAVGSKLGNICIKDPADPAFELKWQGHEGAVNTIHFRHDNNKIICTASRDGSVKVFDSRVAQEAGKHEIEVDDAAASGPVCEALWRGTTEIMSCGDDYCIKRWDVRYVGRGPLSSFFGHSSAVRCIDLSSDTNILVSGTHSGSIRLWLTDELGMIEDMIGTARAQLVDVESRRRKEEDLREFGEGDVDQLRETIRQQKESEAEIKRLSGLKSERVSMACTQAKVCLDGPTFPVDVVKWRDLDGRRALVACGCQDQSIRLFEIDKDVLYNIESWADR